MGGPICWSCEDHLETIEKIRTLLLEAREMLANDIDTASYTRVSYLVERIDAALKEGER